MGCSTLSIILFATLVTAPPPEKTRTSRPGTVAAAAGSAL
jgi:hypothetical protein